MKTELSKYKKYGFNWIGKEEAYEETKEASKKVFALDKKKSINPKKSENIYIEGDNTDALKFLKQHYKNKIRAIYIDPPYNTKKDFVYKDRYNRSSWCSMVYKSLLLSRDLLTNDGVIFISIDDNELSALRMICDEVYGEENFITQFIYEKTQHFGRQKLNTYSNAEYVLCYAKELFKTKTKELLAERINTEFEDAPLFNASNNITVLKFPPKTVDFKIKDGIYKKSKSDCYELLSSVEVKNGINEKEFSIKFKSRWSQKKVLEEIKKGTRFLVKSETFAIRAVYGGDKSATIAPKQIIFTNKNNSHCAFSRFEEQVTTSETGKKDLEKIMEEYCFSYPKPVSLIKYLLSLIYDEKIESFPNDFTVLDFFSGSATTAQAVLELNRHDNGNRKFILVQKPEKINNNNYQTICDIGEERIKRVIKHLYPNNTNGFQILKAEEMFPADIGDNRKH